MDHSHYSIAIVELYHHAEVLEQFLHIIPSSRTNIDIYCSHFAYENIPEVLRNKFTFKVKARHQSISRFISLIQSKIDDYDLIIITTIYSNWRGFSRLLRKNRSLCVIHNTNLIFNSTNSITLFPITFRRCYWYLKELITNTSRQKLEFVKDINQLMCLHTSLLHSFPKTIPPEKINRNLKHLFFNQESKNYKSETLVRITIPGRVDHHKRDYEILLSAFEALSHQLNGIEIEFLGTCIGKRNRDVISQMKRLSRYGCKIISHSNHVSYEMYHQCLKDADFLILPLKSRITVYCYREKYGQTMISGLFGDAIRHGLPAIIPSSSQIIDDDFANFFSGYDSAESLSALILDHIKDCKSHQYKTLMKAYGEVFSLEKRKKEAVSFLKSALHD